MKSIFLCNNPNAVKKVFSPEAVSLINEKSFLSSDCFTENDLSLTPEKFKDVRYIFSTWGMPELTEEQIEKYLPELECVFYGAGSVQSFARPFLNRNIKVFSAWAANAVPVAEYTCAQIILANKGFYRLSRELKEKDYSTVKASAKDFPGNYESALGIIGAGMIGRKVIEMLKNINISIYVFDPFLPDDTAKELNVTKTSLEEIFSLCDVVSNHLADNCDTKGMLDYNLFSEMKPNSTFINTGRGAQVVEKDLIRVLEERPDITAILDVTNPEPPEKDSPFYTLDNCILTPHIAGSYSNELRRMGDFMKDEFLLYAENKPTHYEVTLKMLETMA